MTGQPRPRLLLAAYQCGPGMGSVSQIGWQWYTRLSRHLPVTLVTHIRNRPILEAAGAPLGDSQVIYIDTEWLAGPIYRIAARLFPHSQHATFLLASVDFYLHDWCAYRRLRRHQRTARRWDLVHVVTPVSPRTSTHLHRLGLPLILGPWNGGLASPRQFPNIMRADANWLYSLRRLGRLMDWLLGTTRHARLILIATSATLKTVPAHCRDRCRPMLENAVDPDIFQATPWPPPPSAERPLQVVFVGRLVPFKGVSMLLAATAQCQIRFPIQLTVVGDGPLREQLIGETMTLGIGSRVQFTGDLTPSGVALKLQAAHVFCLPSVRESGGAVVLEAMACARPVVVVAHGGPAEIVDDNVGTALPPDGPRAVIEGLVATFSAVVTNPDDWRQRGLAGRHRAEQEYSWETKIGRAIAYYESLLN